MILIREINSSIHGISMLYYPYVVAPNISVLHKSADSGWNYALNPLIFPRNVGGTCTRRQGRIPVNTGECFLQVPLAWFGLLLRGFARSVIAALSSGRVVGSRSVLVLVGPRVGGFGFLKVGSCFVLVIPSRLVFVCVRLGPSRRVQWFRFSPLLVGVWWWLRSFTFRIGIGRPARALVAYRFCRRSVSRVGRPRPELGNSRCKLAVFK